MQRHVHDMNDGGAALTPEGAFALAGYHVSCLEVNSEQGP